MQPTTLGLKHKGDRHYVHGTDLFLAASKVLSDEAPGHIARITFKRVARNDCILHLKRPKGNVIAEGAYFNSNTLEYFSFFIEEGPHPISKRYSFSEDAITEMATIKSDRIYLQQTNKQYSLIENIVALNKVLHELNHPLRSHNKWLFGQIDLTHYPSKKEGSIRIEETRVIAQKFSISTIYFNSLYLGEIRFIEGRP